MHLFGVPNPRQREFFASVSRYVAYGGARGGGKSWALRRKLILLCLRYPGIRTLIVRRTLPELRGNHLYPLLSELDRLVSYNETAKTFTFPNGSKIILGYCDAQRDVLRYQGQEYDVIALDEATQLTEFQFSTFKACLRGVGGFPKRMYLTCNPGGVGHSWVKRLFIDRVYKDGEDPKDYTFIPARVFDNEVLMKNDPAYVDALKSLPGGLREAWLNGSWDVFEGQYFPEFDRSVHVCEPFRIPAHWKRFSALDYGFDMLAVLWIASDGDRLFVYRELAEPGLTLSRAAEAVVNNTFGEKIEYIAASPDLWNRRQDSGLSGVHTMSAEAGMPPLIRADDRRIPGWRNLREFLQHPENDPEKKPRLQIFSTCTELIRCLPALLHDKQHPEDASSEPHAVTHLPEALRYAVTSFVPDAGNDLNDDPFSAFFTHKNRTGRDIAHY